MAFAEQIKALVKSHAEGDQTRFYSVALQVAASEARRGHSKLAQELREIIDQAHARTEVPAPNASTISIAAPRGELEDLLSVSYPTVRVADMVLSEKISGRITRILSEQRHIGRIKSHGLRPRQRLLLIGPPGCGKTMTASALAGELGIPLFVVRLDGLITKFMGETTAKLRLIFDAIENTRAVYLFDEFDSIGAQRGFANDVGEMRRVLNSFLMFIESHKSTSLLIAATNHPQSLDHALFRRFDDLLEYELPNRSLIEKTLRMRLSLHNDASKFDFPRLANAAKGLNFAEITRACEEAVKEMIINEKHQMTSTSVLRAISERVAFQNKK